MNGLPSYRNVAFLSVVVLFAALVISSSASAVSGGLPPSFGKLCGSVNGASWKFNGQSGTHYDVTGLPARSCAVALKSVGGLTKQKPRTGALGPNTLVGPRGFVCKSSAIKSANAGFCHGAGGAGFVWAPRLKK